MSCFVPEDQSSVLNPSIYGNAHYYSAFLRDLTNKIRGVLRGTIGDDCWEKQFLEAVRGHPQGQFPAASLNQAFDLWAKTAQQNGIQETTAVDIQAAEQNLFALVFPKTRSKGQRKKFNKAKRQQEAALVGMAVDAVGYLQDHPTGWAMEDALVEIEEGMGKEEALPEIEERMEKEEKKPVDFSLAFRGGPPA